MLEIKNINVFYGDVQVIWDVSFRVKEGEIVALIGANGAGKSTILRTISGILRPASGEVVFDGRPIHTMDPYHLIDLGLAHCPEARRLFVEMSVEENLDMGALRGAAKQQRKQTKEMIYGLFPRLKERRRQMSGTLSGGEQQMLAIGRALMAAPKTLLLDEPGMGLAPLVTREIFRHILGLRDRLGLTVLLVEQNARAALKIADRGYVLETGRVMVQGPAQELLANKDVQRAYLGRDQGDR
ncbi:MAG TPA: branched-chain amino acid ABC transporter ATP-binding protein [Desulfovibrio sp.]|nr:branched-chain amino acid ABC transporter ATP-binding protein [Desulfovibrio sp.]